MWNHVLSTPPDQKSQELRRSSRHPMMGGQAEAEAVGSFPAQPNLERTSPDVLQHCWTLVSDGAVPGGCDQEGSTNQ